MKSLIREMMMLDNTKTKVKATPIPNAPNKVDVTPSTGHIPRINTKTGFSENIPLRKFSFLVICTHLYSFKLLLK